MYGDSVDNEAMTREQYLLITLLKTLGSINVARAREAVHSTALAHPEWDMQEIKTWDEWEAQP